MTQKTVQKSLPLDPQALGPIHFVGMGGIGMSGIAEILHSLGYEVQGSDLTENQNIQRLQKLGIKTFKGQDGSHLGHATVVVVSSAVKASNPEVIEARVRKLPVVQRAEMLAELMRLKPSIAIAGTHGKTTTTSLGAAVLEWGGLDPTVISGGIINAYGTNARLGQGDWVIVEADESDGSFTKLPATIGVITNIDPEHMEHYGSLENLHGAFHQFISHIPFYGLGVVCLDHPQVKKMLRGWSDKRIITYGFDPEADVRAEAIRCTGSGMDFTVKISDHAQRLCAKSQVPSEIPNIHLSMLGHHNVQNALAIFAVALELGIPLEKIKQGLAHFGGVRRRFTKTGEVQGVTIIDDYAHHPEEIKAVLKTAALACQKNIIAVVQPHRYSRFKDLFDDFSQCFEGAHKVIVCPIYAAGEDPILGYTHLLLKETLHENGKEVYAIGSEKELAPLLHKMCAEGDYVVCMGAGSITQWAYALPGELEILTGVEPLKKVVNG